MNRIDKAFITCKEKNKKALIGFITAGDPTIEKTKSLVTTMEEAGVDILEIGIPFSDPLADGPVIQNASQRAIKNGVSVDSVFDLVKEARESSDLPIVFLVYYNTIYNYSREKFLQEADAAGVDGLIIPDLPLEEMEEFEHYNKGTNVYIIPLVAPTSKNRVKEITSHGNGFVYCVSSMGVTGRQSDFDANLAYYLNLVKRQTDLPICIGFGISTSDDISKLKGYADGLIVGSKIVDTIYNNQDNDEAVISLIKNLNEATKL